MFKELKVIKLIVFVGLLLAIILNLDFSDNVIADIYTDKISYFNNEPIKIYTSTNPFFSLKRKISVNDVAGIEVSQIEIELSNQESNSNPLAEGLGFKNYIDFRFPKNTKSGIYFIEDKYPVVVKSKKKVEITIVYPFANNALYQLYNGSNVFGKNSEYASLNRTAPIDQYSSGLRGLFNYLDGKYEVNYISDLDLEDINTYSESKLLVLYGKQTCWTPKMKESFNSYLLNKGNVLVMSSYVLNNLCWYDKENHHIVMYKDAENSMTSWLKSGSRPDKNIGISYINGGYSKDSYYQVGYDSHPILKGVKGDSISIEANLFSSPPIIWYDDLPRINLDSMGFYKGEIIAYGKASDRGKNGIKGIFVLQPDSTSGKIVSLGTEDWCLKRNYQEKQQLQLITKNSIDYLLR